MYPVFGSGPRVLSSIKKFLYEVNVKIKNIYIFCLTVKVEAIQSVATLCKAVPIDDFHTPFSLLSAVLWRVETFQFDPAGSLVH